MTVNCPQVIIFNPAPPPPVPDAPTCSFESVPLAEQIPGKLFTVNASGGIGAYSWSVLTDGNITPIDADSASAVFNNAGTNTAMVSSGSQSGQCSMFLYEAPEEPEPEPEPEPTPAVICSPDGEGVEVGQTKTFEAKDGDGINYYWSAPIGDNIISSSGNSATIVFNSSGNKNVIVSSGGNSDTCSVIVSKPKKPAPTVNIYPSLPEVAFDFDEKIATYEIFWSSSNADSCSASGAWSGDKSTSGNNSESFTKLEKGTYTYGITCSNSDNPSVFAETSVRIIEVPICRFAANPTNIVPPQPSNLEWECRYATSCSIDNGVGLASPVNKGFTQVRPKKTTTYNLDCSGADGLRSFPATITIDFIPWLKEVIPIW
jgi:hypothetical protein